MVGYIALGASVLMFFVGTSVAKLTATRIFQGLSLLPLSVIYASIYGVARESPCNANLRGLK